MFILTSRSEDCYRFKGFEGGKMRGSKFEGVSTPLPTPLNVYTPSPISKTSETQKRLVLRGSKSWQVSYVLSKLLVVLHAIL